MTATLRWDDDWLRLDCGPWSIAVADIEVYGDGTAEACLHRWSSTLDSGGAHLLCDYTPEAPTDDHLHGTADSNATVMCRSREEAREVITRLLAVRGIEVPRE